MLLLSVCCEPGPGWVGAGSMHRCPVLKAAGMPCPPFPQEGKTSMILTYFGRGPCLCSIFHHPLFPHFLALFLPEPAASLPLVHFPVESVCPVVGHLSPLKTGFVAGFSTGEKLGAACREFPSPHHSSLIPGSLAVHRVSDAIQPSHPLPPSRAGRYRGEEGKKGDKAPLLCVYPGLSGVSIGTWGE